MCFDCMQFDCLQCTHTVDCILNQKGHLVCKNILLNPLRAAGYIRLAWKTVIKMAVDCLTLSVGVTSGKSAKLEVGERYIQVWAPDNVCVPFPSIITI